MGFADRDYNRVEYGGYRAAGTRRVGTFAMLSVTTWLIITNVAVYILNLLSARAGYGFVIHIPMVTQDGTVFDHPLLFPWVEGIGHFSVLTAIYHLQLWRFLTFQFLHASSTHILLNMIALFFFGPLVEQYLGKGRYLIFYLLCGVAGAVTYVILWSSHILISDPWVPLVGASAGIFGVLIAASQIAPDALVLIYGIIPMRLRIMALVLLAVAAYTVIFQGHNAGGEAAHLGGAALGFVLIKYPRLLDLLTFKRPRRAISHY
jgi:membrane associated rhomboid family serine protease